MTVFIRLASAETITVVMPLYFYANSDSKDCYRMSITAKLFSNMLKRTGADAVMILDSPTPQLEGFFDIPVDNLKVQVGRNRTSKHRVLFFILAPCTNRGLKISSFILLMSIHFRLSRYFAIG